MFIARVREQQPNREPGEESCSVSMHLSGEFLFSGSNERIPFQE